MIFFIFQTPGDSDNFPLFFVKHKEKKEEDKNEHFQHLVLYWGNVKSQFLVIVKNIVTFIKVVIGNIKKKKLKFKSS